MRPLPARFVAILLILLAAALAACGPVAMPDGDPGQLLVGSAPSPSPESAASPEAAAPDAATPAPAESDPGELPGLAVPTPASIEPRALTALGDPDAPVTIVEYSDYHCPFCQRHHQQTLPQLIENYIDTGRVYYVFKDFPIASLHPLAYRLHEAALCIGNEAGGDTYWTAHDRFFEESQFGAQAGSLEQLDSNLIAALSEKYPGLAGCLESGEYSDEVNAGIAEGMQLGVNGTPSFFVNGFPVTGAQPYDVFEFVIGLAEEGGLESAFREAAQQQAAAIATATAQGRHPRGYPPGRVARQRRPGPAVVLLKISTTSAVLLGAFSGKPSPRCTDTSTPGQELLVFQE